MDLPASLLESAITRGAILFSSIFEEIDHGKYFVIVYAGLLDAIVQLSFDFISKVVVPASEDTPREDGVTSQYGAAVWLI